MGPIILYYKVNHPNTLISLLQTYSTLYYDEECTQDAGYYYVSKTKNDISPNQVYGVQMTLYFSRKILTYSYVKYNNETINTPITYINTWDGKTPLGYVNRLFLNDNVTRQLTLYL